MRRALVSHYMSAESLLPWCPPAEDEPMGRLDHRDPYASRGTTDIVTPHIRPDGNGGCAR